MRGVAGGVRGRTARKPKGRAAHGRAWTHFRARVAPPGACVSCAGEGCRVCGPRRALSQSLTPSSRMFLLHNTTLLVVALLVLRTGRRGRLRHRDGPIARVRHAARLPARPCCNSSGAGDACRSCSRSYDGSIAKLAYWVRSGGP